MRDPAGSVAATVLLGVAGLAAALYALRFAAAAAGWSFSPFEALPSPSSHGLAALLTVLVMALVVGLLALVLRDDERRLWLPGGGGGVLLPAAAVEAVAEEAAGAHPDVVRAKAHAHRRGAASAIELRVALRPMSDAGDVAAAVAAAAQTAAAPLVGEPQVMVRTHVRVLRVRQLPRYLP